MGIGQTAVPHTRCRSPTIVALEVDEHAAVVQYLKDLEHGCVDGDSTYEDRKAARAKEIEALGKAQIILRDAFKDAEKPKEEKTM